MSDVCTACLRRICVCPCHCPDCTPAAETWRHVAFTQPPALPEHDTDLEDNSP